MTLGRVNVVKLLVHGAETEILVVKLSGKAPTEKKKKKNHWKMLT